MKTESQLLTWFKEQELTIKFNKGSVEVKNKSNKIILRMFYNQYPDCCGIVIIRDFVSSYGYNGFKEAITNTLLLFEIYCREEPDEEGDSVLTNVPYGMIIAAHIDEDFIGAALQAGFKEICNFENPKTENQVYTIGKIL